MGGMASLHSNAIRQPCFSSGHTRMTLQSVPLLATIPRL